MTVYDPHDWGHDDEPPGPEWPDVLLAAVFLLVAAALIGSCSH